MVKCLRQLAFTHAHYDHVTRESHVLGSTSHSAGEATNNVIQAVRLSPYLWVGSGSLSLTRQFRRGRGRRRRRERGRSGRGFNLNFLLTKD